MLQKAQTAKENATESEICEQIKLVYAEYQIGKYTTEVKKKEITERLEQIYGNNVTSVSLNNGILKAKIYGKTYQYNSTTGIAGEYIYVDPFNYGTKTKETLTPGDDIILETEKFKVFSVANGKIKAMPYYNLKLDSNPIKQATSLDTYDSAGKTSFSTEVYWDRGVDEIDMGDSRNNVQQYIIAYKKTLEELGAEGLEVRIARYTELSSDVITNEMRNPDGGIGYFWLGSGGLWTDGFVWFIENGGSINQYWSNWVYGVRPIIIIEK